MWRARDAQVPMGHMGDAWDVANAACFFLASEIPLRTGIELVVDGGITVKASSARNPRYCAIASMPPAKECQGGVMLIGQFRSLTAISAMPP